MPAYWIVDPAEPRPAARELVMVMNGYDTDADGENNFYTVNGRSFYYARYPIRVRRSELVRIYLANLTEFGQTPLFTTEEVASAGVAIALYPLSAFRAMNKAALTVYQALHRDGTQKNVVDTMQTRSELYDFLGYHDYEQRLDRLFARTKS